MELPTGVKKYSDGHFSKLGKSANIMKNPIWKVTENEKEYLLMYCEKDTICKLCFESYQKILDYEKTIDKKITWYKHQNGYIICSQNIYIHQIIMNCYGNGKGTKNISVDHIDQDPLNNTIENLRIATRKEQEQNTKGIKEGTKRERKHSAKELPNGITQEMMKKYVVYYHEWLDKEHTKKREFFKIEKHPKLDKPWTTTKSEKVSIQEKLNQANKVVQDLDNNIYPEKEGLQLPKYVSLVNMRGKNHLVFEKIHHNEKRLNLKMVLPNEYDLHDQIMLLKIKVREKYGFSAIGNDIIFNYIYDTIIDDKNKYVNKITFEISRCGKIKKTLSFEIKKTEKEAILEAEKWLSEILDEDYFNKVNTEQSSFEIFKNRTRGIVLSSAIFIEYITKIDSNHIYLECGS